MHFLHRFPTIPQPKMRNHLRLWLRAYAESTSGVEMRAKAPVEFDDGSRTQVDALLRIQEDAGGRSRVVNDRIVGAPELIVEVSDRVCMGDALKRQRKKGIPEHIAVNDDGEPTWFSPGTYHLHSDDDSVTSGTTFPGLKLHIVSFYEDDLKRQLTQLEEDLGSDEHRSFEENLEATG